MIDANAPIRCFLEIPLSEMALLAPRLRRRSLEAMAVIVIHNTENMADGWERFAAESWERVSALREIAPDRRAVRVDWAGNNEIKFGTNTQQTYLVLNEIANRWDGDDVLGREQFRFGYVDQEHPDVDAVARLNGLCAPLGRMCQQWGNYNYVSGVPSIKQVGWWGPTYPRAGNASCPEAYCWHGPVWERWIATRNQVRSANALEPGSAVPVLPVLSSYSSVPNNGLTDEQAAAMTRAGVIHDILSGTRTLTWAVYMTPPEEHDRMADAIQDGIDTAERWLSRPIRNPLSLSMKTRNSPRRTYKAVEIPSDAAIVETAGFGTSRGSFGV
jgi:hypothetical protein